MQASSSVISQGVLTTLRVLMLCVSLPCSTLAAHAIGPAAGAVVSPQLPDRVAGNQCAICHIRLVWTRSATTHVDEWVTSKHATYGVGCEQCHGGDPAATSGAAAHRGVLNSANPSSRVHWMALPSTCGHCHRPELASFAQSSHDDLLTQGDATVPTCTSCHSSMAADVPSPATLERQCARCHANDRSDRAHTARRQLDDIVTLRAALTRARLEIAAVADFDRHAALSARWSDADRTLRQVAAAVHAFDLRRVDDRLADVRAQIESLQRQLSTSK